MKYTIKPPTMELSQLIKEIEEQSKEVALELETLIVTSKLLNHTITIYEQKSIFIQINTRESIHLFWGTQDQKLIMIIIILGSNLIKKINKNEITYKPNRLQLTKTTNKDIIETIQQLSTII